MIKAFTELEVESVRGYFPESMVLSKQNATLQAIRNFTGFPIVHCAHFACHGRFNPKAPMESALILADGEHWSLNDVFDLSLSQCHLITLSACETSLTDFGSISDEYIGFPHGFLYAGSTNVVGSLWRVSDLSTTFLMIKFYENMSRSQQLKVSEALMQAQHWLRNATTSELDDFRTQNQAQFDQATRQWRPSQRLMYQELLKLALKRQPRPFANPYYWAAFTVTGC